MVVLPPFYFRNASKEGLFTWFSEVMHASVPKDGYLLGYHFPAVSGVPLPLSLLTQLRESYPDQFAGLKDSSGDYDHAVTLAKELDDRLILVGNDKLLIPALTAGASGCITALANLVSPMLREIWDAYQEGEKGETIQRKVNQARDVLDQYPPFSASVKGLLAQLHKFPHWPVKPPLVSFSEGEMKQAAEKMRAVLTE